MPGANTIGYRVGVVLLYVAKCAGLATRARAMVQVHEAQARVTDSHSAAIGVAFAFRAFGRLVGYLGLALHERS